MYPWVGTLTRLLPVLAAAALVAGCGGSSAPEAVPTKVVRGPGFTFSTPVDRTVTRSERTVTVVGASGAEAELESATRFPLVKAFRPSLWPGVVTEVDGVAAKLAAGLGGAVESAQDVRVDGRRARRYEIVHRREGQERRQRITFVFRGRYEFQLLCSFPDGPTPEACVLLESSFRTV